MNDWKSWNGFSLGALAITVAIIHPFKFGGLALQAGMLFAGIMVSATFLISMINDIVIDAMAGPSRRPRRQG